MTDVKFKRVWFFGGDAKDDAMIGGDFVERYEASNGLEIKPVFWFGNNNPVAYEIRDRGTTIHEVRYLKDAKNFVREYQTGGVQ